MGDLRSSEYNEDVLKFLRLSGATKNMEMALDAMLAQQGDELPAEILDGFRQKWLDNMDDMMLELTSIYRKHFTQSEIQELIRIYESPIGRKMVASNPSIMEESMAIGAQYGQKLMEEVLEEYDV